MNRLASVFSLPRQAPALRRALHQSAVANAKVTVAGGGNAAHVAAGMFANNGHEVNLFFSFEEEAKAFRTGCEAGDGVTVTYLDESYKGKPSVISADPAEAVPGAEVIVIIAPAYAHEPILKQMQPHVSPGTFLGAIPAPGCFDLLAKHTLGPQFIQDNDITIFGGSSLPWACRTTEYGQSVSLLGAKTVVDVTASPDVAESNDRLAKLLTDFHHVTEYRVGGHFLITSMWPTNCIIHTGTMYGIWHDWDGTPVETAPLFYQNCSENTGRILQGLDDDIQRTKHALEKAMNVDLSALLPIVPYLKEAYGHEIVDDSTISQMFKTNRAFRGLTAPMMDAPDGSGRLVPNYQTRYLVEDLPHGLAVLRGLGEVAGVETPFFDEVLLWCQEQIGHSYLVDGKIQGKDVEHSGCPQRWGITDPSGLL